VARAATIVCCCCRLGSACWYDCLCFLFPSMMWLCWLDDKKDIQPLKQIMPFIAESLFQNSGGRNGGNRPLHVYPEIAEKRTFWPDNKEKRAVTSYGWEGNRRFGVVLAMRLRHLQTQGLSEGGDYMSTTPIHSFWVRRPLSLSASRILQV